MRNWASTSGQVNCRILWVSAVIWVQTVYLHWYCGPCLETIRIPSLLPLGKHLIQSTLNREGTCLSVWHAAGPGRAKQRQVPIFLRERTGITGWETSSAGNGEEAFLRNQASHETQCAWCKVCLLTNVSFPVQFRSEQNIPLTTTAHVAFS